MFRIGSPERYDFKRSSIQMSQFFPKIPNHAECDRSHSTTPYAPYFLNPPYTSPSRAVNISQIIDNAPCIRDAFKYTPSQIDRLIDVTQTLCDNSVNVSQAFRCLETYLENPEKKQIFSDCLADIRHDVCRFLKRTMHDKTIFQRPKTYHTEYHAREMQSDISALYEGHPLQDFMATLGFVHDVIQYYPPQRNSAESKNEDESVSVFLKLLRANREKIGLSQSLFSGIELLAHAIIVQGTYLVNCVESEGVLAMRLLKHCYDQTTSITQIKLEMILQELKPVFEAISKVGMSDIHRISFPAVSASHRQLLLQAGFTSYLGESLETNTDLLHLFYWASHSTRIGGELATYVVDSGYRFEGQTLAQCEGGSRPFCSDFHSLFSNIRDAFLANDANRLNDLLAQPVAKLGQSQDAVTKTKCFYEHIYDHLIADRAFIAHKNPNDVGSVFGALYSESRSFLTFGDNVYTGVMRMHSEIETYLSSLSKNSAVFGKKQFVKIVLYGAVFQDGYRDVMQPVLGRLSDQIIGGHVKTNLLGHCKTFVTKAIFPPLRG
jgi:hypothetical protein